MPNIISEYFNKISRHVNSGQATEHTYRGTLESLLEAFAPEITAIQRAYPDCLRRARPCILRDNLTVGYVEAKDIGQPLDQIARSAQLKKYRDALDNLILTDYLRFIWFVDGEERSRVTAAAQTGSGELRFNDKGWMNWLPCWRSL
jgi:hypothetical protein